VSEAQRTAQIGIQLCRKGDWAAGVHHLAQAVEAARGEELPSQAYSFLGYGVAYTQRRHKEGLDLCRHALRLSFTEPDNHLNLARVHSLMGNRRLAIRAVGEGLTLSPNHPPLLALYREMGIRREPVLRFLHRNHLLNRILGRVRHDFSKP
jgi:tetratricopeptide (TPR) repeat protein